MSNSSSVQGAQLLVNKFIEFGIRNFVISPGSRNGAISLALAAANDKKLINLAVRLDERSAAFVALGMALKTNSPAVVVCTSGTAAANLLPALIEAKYSSIPLIAITADRPTALINTGVSQTIEQENLFDSAIKLKISLDSEDADFKNWTAKLDHLLITLKQEFQPSQINIHFTEPLVPKEEFEFTSLGEYQPATEEFIELPNDFLNKKGLIISGAVTKNSDAYVNELAAALSWPLVAEPPSLAFVNKISHHPAVLNALPENLQPEVLLTVGRVGLSRPVSKLIANIERRIHLASPRALNQVRGEIVTSHLAKLPKANPVTEWLTNWQEIGKKSEVVINARKIVQPDLLQVVNNLFLNAVDNSHIHLSASLAARDFELMLTQEIAQMMSKRSITLSMNRGANGIDGVVSTAYGLALSEPERQHYCLLGDIAALHDLSGFALPVGEIPVNLHFVIVNNNGGGIFSTLEQAGVTNFERVYSTAHGIEIDKVLAQLKVKQVNPGAKFEIKSAPGVSSQVFNVEPIDKVKEIREEVYSLVKKAIN